MVGRNEVNRRNRRETCALKLGKLKDSEPKEELAPYGEELQACRGRYDRSYEKAHEHRIEPAQREQERHRSETWLRLRDRDRVTKMTVGLTLVAGLIEECLQSRAEMERKRRERLDGVLAEFFNMKQQ